MLAAIVVAAGTAVSLLRTTGAGPFQTIWEEDARDLLTYALLRPSLFNIFSPYVGYFQVVPRLMGEVATLFPVSWAAAVMSVQAAVAAALLAVAVYVACGAHLRHPLARLLVSAPLLFSATAENVLSEIYNRPACVQFFLVYALFWLLLWTPHRRAARLTQVIVVALAGVSSFLAVIYVPLVLVRLYARRDVLSLALAGVLVAGSGLQVLGAVLELSNRDFVHPRYQPLWALASFAVWALPHSVLGFRYARPLTDVVQLTEVWLIALAWLAVLGPLVVALRRLPRPAWVLATVAFVHSVGLCVMTIMANGGVTQRYLLPVQMLLLSALVALLLPAADRRSFRLALDPLAALAVLVLAVAAVNYRWDDTWRAKGPLWTSQVRRAAVECQAPGRQEVIVRSGPQPWFSLVTVPCHDLTKDRTHHWCQEPYCVYVDTPPSTPPHQPS